jgi:hypothetical protein
MCEKKGSRVWDWGKGWQKEWMFKVQLMWVLRYHNGICFVYEIAVLMEQGLGMDLRDCSKWTCGYIEIRRLGRTCSGLEDMRSCEGFEICV